MDQETNDKEDPKQRKRDHTPRMRVEEAVEKKQVNRLANTSCSQLKPC